MIFDFEPPARKNFTIATKRIEWLKVAGKTGEKPLLNYLTTGKIGKLGTSKCRKCKIVLRWGDGKYNFDHKDNNPRNNSQRNCYLVCRNCHGQATKIEKRAVRGIFGEVEGYKTIKRKVSYKKPKATTTKKKVTAKSSKQKSTTTTRKRTNR